VLVFAKAPTPGRVKTRLCPPCTVEQAALVAAAALRDTLDAVDDAMGASRRVLVVDHPSAGGAPDEDTVDTPLWPRPGWDVVGQREGGLGERIGHAFVDTAVDGWSSLLIGMDTPQVTGALLASSAAMLHGAGAVLGPAADGGWWLLGLHDPSWASMLAAIPTSRPDTGDRTRAALAAAGLAVTTAPSLRDVDTAADARAVAELCRPGGRFPIAVARHVPAPVVAGRSP
jgi:hypothetical protein